MTTAIKCDRCDTEYPEGETHECKEEQRSADAGDIKTLLDEVKELAATRKR